MSTIVGLTRALLRDRTVACIVVVLVVCMVLVVVVACQRGARVRLGPMATAVVADFMLQVVMAVLVMFTTTATAAAAAADFTQGTVRVVRAVPVVMVVRARTMPTAAAAGCSRRQQAVPGGTVVMAAVVAGTDLSVGTRGAPVAVDWPTSYSIRCQQGQAR